jgi:hypothetical protein
MKVANPVIALNYSFYNSHKLVHTAHLPGFLSNRCPTKKLKICDIFFASRYSFTSV